MSGKAKTGSSEAKGVKKTTTTTRTTRKSSPHKGKKAKTVTKSPKVVNTTDGVTKPSAVRRHHYKTKRSNVLGLLTRNPLGKNIRVKTRNSEGGKEREKDRDGVTLPFDTLKELEARAGPLDPFLSAKKAAVRGLLKLVLAFKMYEEKGIPLNPKQKLQLESFGSQKFISRGRNVPSDAKQDNQGFNAFAARLANESTFVSRDAKQALEKVEENITRGVLEQTHAFAVASGTQGIHGRHLEAQRVAAYGEKKALDVVKPGRGQVLYNYHMLTSVQFLVYNQ